MVIDVDSDVTGRHNVPGALSIVTHTRSPIARGVEQFTTIVLDKLRQHLPITTYIAYLANTQSPTTTCEVISWPPPWLQTDVLYHHCDPTVFLLVIMITVPSNTRHKFQNIINLCPHVP